MTTWSEFFAAKGPRLELPSGNRAMLLRDNYGDEVLAITSGPEQVNLPRTDTRCLRDFLNEILPKSEEAGEAPIDSARAEAAALLADARRRDAESRPPLDGSAGRCEDAPPYGAKTTEPAVAAATPDLTASRATATAMADDLKEKEAEPEAPAAAGDEEVVETPAPAPATNRSDELVVSIVALIKRFISRDYGRWAYTGEIFHSRKTTESEVVLGKITDVAVLRAIRADLEAAWAKLTAPAPPKKSKKIADR